MLYLYNVFFFEFQGLIKIRGDRCWWDLTCMNYHYEVVYLNLSNINQSHYKNNILSLLCYLYYILLCKHDVLQKNFTLHTYIIFLHVGCVFLKWAYLTQKTMTCIFSWDTPT